MKATITEIFKKGIESETHNIFYRSSHNTPTQTTDRPQITNISTDNNDLSVNLIRNFVNNENNSLYESAQFKLTYTGAQKTFTSNIDLTIDGVTGIDNSTEFNIQCKGTLELKPLRFHNKSNTSKTINLSASTSDSSFAQKYLDIEYYISADEPDENSWINLSNVTINPIYLTIQSFTIPAHESLWVRSNKNSNKMSSWYNENNYFYFNSDDNNIGGIELGGDIMSIINSNTMPNYCFYGLFNYLKALSSIESDFTLPADLSDHCYQNMFYGCTSLTTVPTNLLPATTLKYACYTGMFLNCTSLEYIPENLLRAPTLTNYCYQDMFNGCTSLEYIPENLLQATTLASSCYTQMFRDCTSLTTIYENLLPVKRLTSSCYQGMFYGCTSLTTIPENLLPATTLSNNCYQEMFMGCRNLINTPKLLAETIGQYCYNQMFRDCSNLTNIPTTLPATTLYIGCYSSMFNGCAKITTAPELPATTLVTDCYNSMFISCAILNKITMLATNINASGCLSNWVNTVSSSGTFIKYANTTLPSGNSGIPSGWTIQSYVPTND